MDKKSSILGGAFLISKYTEELKKQIVLEHKIWNLSDSPNYAQTVDMLEKAFAQIPDGTNLILHSDQGWQYQMNDYQKRLKEKGIRQSMSRKGNCLDNSVMENFFGLLKSELLYLQEFKSVEHFKKELIEYLSWYNEKRIKVKLKGLGINIQHRNQQDSCPK